MPNDEISEVVENRIKEEKPAKTFNLIFTIIGVILLVVLIPLLAAELTLAIEGATRDTPPDLFGYIPLSVESGSMEGENKDNFSKGDLIWIKQLDEEEVNGLEIGDIITYSLEEGDETTYITHRIVNIVYESDNKTIASFTTKGDANRDNDSKAVYPYQVIGVYSSKWKGWGNFGDFMKSAEGIVLVVALPIVIFILVDVTYVLISRHNRKMREAAQITNNEKDAEIERLTKLLEDKEKESQEDGKKPKE